MCTSVARPFDVIIGSRSKRCLRAERSWSGPSLDLNGPCSPWAAPFGWQKAPHTFGDLRLLATGALTGEEPLPERKRSRTRVISKGLNRKDNDICHE